MSEIDRRRVRAIIAGHLNVAIARVQDNADFRLDLKADSLDLVEIPALLEEAFAIRISDDEAEFCESVGTAIDLVETKLENKRLAA